MSIEPARPQASHATASAGGRGPFCEPAMKRVAPLSGRNSVAVGILREGLAKVYHADRIVQELAE